MLRLRGKFRVTRVVILAALFAALFSGLSGPAHAASSTPAQVDHYCAVIVKRVGNTSDTTVVNQVCARSKSDASLAIPADDATLATFYENDNFGGFSVDLIGIDGPCDSLGYTFNDTSFYNDVVDGITSYRVFNNCGDTLIYHDVNRQNLCGDVHRGDVSNVGSFCNDHLLSIHIFQ